MTIAIRFYLRSALGLILLALLLPAWAANTKTTPNERLPVVFVHGSSGSASQFQTHAMRFTSNHYPQDLLYVFEYDTAPEFSENAEAVRSQLDSFLSNVLEETGAEAVNAVGHSRGTAVMTTYLEQIEGGSDKVARYVNIDGRAMPELPGGVPTIGIWGEWNSGEERAQIGPNPEDNYYFPGMAHTEVATSPQAFAHMYEFFTGKTPRTTDVVPEPPGRITIAGRATLFPQNAGFEGAELEIWRVSRFTGHRLGHKPVHTQQLDASGAFGPIRVNGLKHYEFALKRPDGSVHHFYQQRFVRSNHFVRLESSRAGTGIDGYVNKGESHMALNVVRQRELWGDQGERSDELSIDGTNVLTGAISPRAHVVISLFAFDQGAQGSDLEAGILPPFGEVPFLTAADVYIPASMPPSDVVPVELTARPRDAGRPDDNTSSTTQPASPQAFGRPHGRSNNRHAVINVPNWASSNHRVTVRFRDYIQNGYGFFEYDWWR